jgi:hypothetical protein
MAESEAKEQSEFNDALGYLRRINACLYSADIAKFDSNLYSWFQALNSFYDELSTEIKDLDTEKFDREFIDDINNNLVATQMRKDNRPTAELIWKLRKYERALRRIYKDSGLQMRMQSDASKALFRS